MSSLSPKPIIAQLHGTWRVPPGMTFALVEDVERRVWIVESCPAGTQFWTVAQAGELVTGARTRGALQTAVREGQLLEAALQTPAPLAHDRLTPPADAPARYRSMTGRSLRSSSTRDRAEKTLARA